MYELEVFSKKSMGAPLSELFSTSSRKLLSGPKGFIMFGTSGVDFFCTSGFLYPNTKERLELIRARPNFYSTTYKPNVAIANVVCWLYTRSIAVKVDFYKERMDMFAYIPVGFKYLGTLLETRLLSLRKKFSIMLQFVGLLLQWIQLLHSMNWTQPILLDIKNLI